SELATREPFETDFNDPRLPEEFSEPILNPAGTHAEGLRAILTHTTQGSGFVLACGMDHVLSVEDEISTQLSSQDDFAAVVFRGMLGATRTLRLQKYLSYHYSDDTPPLLLRSQSGWTLDRAVQAGFSSVLADHSAVVE